MSVKDIDSPEELGSWAIVNSPWGFLYVWTSLYGLEELHLWMSLDSQISLHLK